MIKRLILILLLIQPLQTVLAKAPSSYEIPRTEILPIQDPQTRGEYELYVKLPDNYTNNPNKIYPVIYFTDADWHIEMLSSMTEFIMEDVILVGISWQRNLDKKRLQEVGAYLSRLKDLTVYKSNDAARQKKYQYGQADTHLTFIRNQVIPFVERKYRTNPSQRSYFGYSLGGLFGAYALLKSPDTFKNYIIGSPAANRLTQLAKQFAGKQNLNANVYITYGDQEHARGKQIDEFVELLERRNDKTLSLKLEVVTGDHSTASPMTGVTSLNWLASLATNKEQ